MSTIAKQSMIILLVLVFAIAPVSVSYAQNDEITGASVAGDILILRPIGFVATVLGVAVFVISLPFTIPGGSVKQVAKATIVRPAQYTFVRPIGEGM